MGTTVSTTRSTTGSKSELTSGKGRQNLDAASFPEQSSAAREGLRLLASYKEKINEICRKRLDFVIEATAIAEDESGEEVSLLGRFTPRMQAKVPGYITVRKSIGPELVSATRSGNGPVFQMPDCKYMLLAMVGDKPCVNRYGIKNITAICQ